MAENSSQSPIPTSTPTFTRAFRVRNYECDVLGHVNNAVYQQYLQEAAIEASAALGYPLEWYNSRGEVWIIRKISVGYHRPARTGEILDVTTWVSNFSRVRSQREYVARRRSDGETIVRANATWVYVDRATGRPRSIPAEFGPVFGASGQFALDPYTLPAEGIASGVFRWRHRVARYELDSNRHVNNAIYLNWVEEAKFQAADQVGWPLERMEAENLLIVQVRHDTEYFAPAVAGDEIEVVSRVYDLRRVRGTWRHEIRRTPTGELLALNYSTGAFLDLAGRPRLAPQSMLDALLAGEDTPR